MSEQPAGPYSGSSHFIFGLKLFLIAGAVLALLWAADRAAQ